MAVDITRFRHIEYSIVIAQAADGAPPLTWCGRFDARIVAKADVLARIATLQKSVAEIFCDKETAIRHRLHGSLDGYRVRFVDAFADACNGDGFFNIVFCDEIPDGADPAPGVIAVFCGAAERCPAGAIHHEALTPERLKRTLLEAIAALRGPDRESLDALKDVVGFEPVWQPFDFAHTVAPGYYTRPLLAVLRSLRIHVQAGDRSDGYDEERLVDLIDLFAKIRKAFPRIPDSPPPAALLYLTDASASRDFASNPDLYSEAALRSRGAEDPRQMAAAIRYAEQGRSDGDAANRYIAEFEDERRLLDSLIALAAADDVAPVVRMRLGNRDVAADVNRLGDVERGDGRKLQTMAQRLRKQLAPHLDPWLEYLDAMPSAPLKLVSNLPLEWGFSQGLPLMVRHEVSRIPVAPGYATARLLLRNDKLHLKPSSLQTILFVSSFADDDPIRDHLKDALATLHNLDSAEQGVAPLKAAGLLAEDFRLPADASGLDVRIDWKNVANRAELIAAVKAHRHAITVFDLHGSHGSDGGLIHLRDEAVSVFDLHRDLRISPIVILSACDTSPVDRGHDSVAEAFFLAGARTLISSALPIHSVRASTFLARLVVRIKHCLPVELRYGPLRWSRFVAGMIRRTYFSELIALLQKQYKFDSATKRLLIYETGILVDPLHPDWVQATQAAIAARLGIGSDELDEFVSRNVQFLECMKYLQLGRPESIIISADAGA